MNGIILSRVFFILTLISIVGQFANAAELYLAKNESTNKYIVVLKDEKNNYQNIMSQYAGLSRVEKATLMSYEYGLNMKRVYNSVINGFVVEGGLNAIKSLSNNQEIEYIEQVSVSSIDATQSNAVWNLDRIDQRTNYLNGKYTYDRTGQGVNAYIIDTGIRTSHTEFEGRARTGWDFINNSVGDGTDCHGHGTHVAGIVGGKTYGVAKSVTLISLRIGTCEGKLATDDIIAALDWVIDNGEKPGVVNMSIRANPSIAVDTAVKNTTNAGFTVVVSAGNDSKDACTQSPARANEAITVGATDSDDRRASFSNYGKCVDVWAPGVDVTSAFATSDTDTATRSGTSMAAPHVTGIAALYFEGATNASASAVIDNIMGKVTYGMVSDTVTADTPNLLAYSKGTSNTYSAIHQYYHDGVKNHFYTKNWSELQSASSTGWVYQGVLGYAYRKIISNTNALYRYYHPDVKNHFYTINYGELGEGHSGWIYEGIAAYLPKSGNTKNIFRYYNSEDHDHYYTTDWNELGGGNSDWQYEGIEGKVFAGPQD
ncbi:S8 family serine peptidase [Microbulbifer thermotolerans]|uniref:S8 family serine peptidase n=1 Tax=Microbulbifer thermotolerans TaxID=252514 RepID=A0AB35I2L5_MICTH|nr:S8 family serine peptidase [Microbulbifer thermotolerans]MCX2803314.1 S8 family serine peptidase [Microbulbifer thermotolerans]